MAYLFDVFFLSYSFVFLVIFKVGLQRWKEYTCNWKQVKGQIPWISRQYTEKAMLFQLLALENIQAAAVTVNDFLQSSRRELRTIFWGFLISEYPKYIPIQHTPNIFFHTFEQTFNHFLTNESTKHHHKQVLANPLFSSVMGFIKDGKTSFFFRSRGFFSFFGGSDKPPSHATWATNRASWSWPRDVKNETSCKRNEQNLLRNLYKIETDLFLTKLINSLSKKRLHFTSDS